MEVQQSPLYSNFIRLLKWQIIQIDGINIFFRHFPFIGTLAKIQRPEKLPQARKLIAVFKRDGFALICVCHSELARNLFFVRDSSADASE